MAKRGDKFVGAAAIARASFWGCCPPTDRTLIHVVVSGGAMVSAETNELNVEAVPAGLIGEPSLECCLGSVHALCVAYTPSTSEPVDVRVDWEGRLSEPVDEHYGGRLVTHTRECLQLLQGIRNLTAVHID